MFALVADSWRSYLSGDRSKGVLLVGDCREGRSRADPPLTRNYQIDMLDHGGPAWVLCHACYGYLAISNW